MLAAISAWAKPSTIAAPPMSFFISSIPSPGLDVESTGVEAHAFSDQRYLGCVVPPQVKSSRPGACVLARPTA